MRSVLLLLLLLLIGASVTVNHSVTVSQSVSQIIKWKCVPTTASEI